MFISRVAMAGTLRTTVIGSGNWGTAIARVVGQTIIHHEDFYNTVRMWVFEEQVDGENLSDIINTRHENVKYLPGKILPKNVVAVPDLVEAITGADVLVFVVPHQFVTGICNQIAGKTKPNAYAVSLIKGIEVQLVPVEEVHHIEGVKVREDGGIKLISEVIKDILGIDVGVLMGANLAFEVASDRFCEATIGCSNFKRRAPMLKRLFETDNLRITCVNDAHTVEMCGALKNIVAVAAGLTDGLGYGDNTKAAVIRLGLMEMTKFVEHFYPGSNLATFFESCGVADLITTCYGGRNRKVAEAFVTTGKTMEQLEIEMLKGQRLQGPHTAEQVYKMLTSHEMQERFPLFASVHKICIGEMQPKDMIVCLRHHPEHI